MLWVWRRWVRRNTIWRTYRVVVLLLRTLYVINRERTRVIKAHAAGHYDVHPNIEALVEVLHQFRLAAVALGGLMIKLGQFLGARADLLPEEALAELASLHDEVPAERFDDIQRVLEREWHRPVGEVCAEINPIPAGSASLGQVHYARLHDGREVALKVQRPGIGAIVRADLRALRFVLRVVAWLAPEANRITDLAALHQEFARTVGEELDYIHEADNAVRFAQNFADDYFIRAPEVVPEYSTRRVLVLQWMDGIKITDIPALEAAGVDRLALANRITEAYLKQVLEDNFFHADPHPGNLLVQPYPEGDRIVFLDFGMMGVITPSMREGLRDIFTGVMTSDERAIVRGLGALEFLSDNADRDAIAQVARTMLARYTQSGGVRGFREMQMQEIREVRQAWRAGEGGRMRRSNRPNGPNRPDTDAQAVLGDVSATMYDRPFRLPAQFAFFGRMAAMLLGLNSTLSPDYNFIEVATPYAQQFLSSNGNPLEGVLRLLGVPSLETLGRDLLRDSVATARILAALPSRIDRLLEHVERGDLQVVVESRTGRRLRGRPLVEVPAKPSRSPRSLLARPVPVWLPLGLVGVFAIAQLVRRVLRATGPHMPLEGGER